MALIHNDSFRPNNFQMSETNRCVLKPVMIYSFMDFIIIIIITFSTNAGIEHCVSDDECLTTYNTY